MGTILLESCTESFHEVECELFMFIFGGNVGVNVRKHWHSCAWLGLCTTTLENLALVALDRVAIASLHLVWMSGTFRLLASL